MECWLGLREKWKYLMLRSLTHDEVIVEAKGGLVDQVTSSSWKNLGKTETCQMPQKNAFHGDAS